jgi:hypothetical protein
MTIQCNLDADQFAPLPFRKGLRAAFQDALPKLHTRCCTRSQAVSLDRVDHGASNRKCGRAGEQRHVAVGLGASLGIVAH